MGECAGCSGRCTPTRVFTACRDRASTSVAGTSSPSRSTCSRSPTPDPRASGLRDRSCGERMSRWRTPVTSRPAETTGTSFGTRKHGGQPDADDAFRHRADLRDPLLRAAAPGKGPGGWLGFSWDPIDRFELPAAEFASRSRLRERVALAIRDAYRPGVPSAPARAPPLAHVRTGAEPAAPEPASQRSGRSSSRGSEEKTRPKAATARNRLARAEITTVTAVLASLVKVRIAANPS